ncbi:isochorismatase family protein [Tamaricihabitans halophyticus]|uniref:isochorismatase family protein n=1 Tax=Tamaricihabitans halophyticus TaxID=1262583 RepID=UPI001049B711|nr:isochorismatase family protein [Tamaricihabitans halophyticus]
MAVALPKIDPYQLPTVAELPSGRVDWRPEPARAALLVHDMQRYFLKPFAGSPMHELTANIARLLAIARAQRIPIFYTAQPSRPEPADRGLQSEFWGDGIGGVIDTEPKAADVLEVLAPEPGDEVLVKWRYSAFSRSPLAEQLAARGRDQLLISGVYAHIGCQATAVDAFMRDVRPFLVADAVGDFSRQRHDQACEYVAQRCGAVINTDAAVTALAETVPIGGN